MGMVKGVTLLWCQYSQATCQYYVVITKQIHDAMGRKATYHSLVCHIASEL